jgi:hypothetical protein
LGEEPATTERLAEVEHRAKKWCRFFATNDAH